MSSANDSDDDFRLAGSDFSGHSDSDPDNGGPLRLSVDSPIHQNEQRPPSYYDEIDTSKCLEMSNSGSDSPDNSPKCAKVRRNDSDSSAQQNEERHPYYYDIDSTIDNEQKCAEMSNSDSDTSASTPAKCAKIQRSDSGLSSFSSSYRNRNSYSSDMDQATNSDNEEALYPYTSNSFDLSNLPNVNDHDNSSSPSTSYNPSNASYSPVKSKKPKSEHIFEDYSPQKALKRSYSEISTESKTYSPLDFNPTENRKSSGLNFKPSYEAASVHKPIKEGKGADLMKKMGYKMGEGLGKHKQGMVDPIKPSTQSGRRGLGSVALEDLPGLVESSKKWDRSMEVIHLKEEKEWLESPFIDSISISELRSWIKEGPHNVDNIHTMTDFIHPELLNNILNCKSNFDKIEDKALLKQARTRSNPFELIKGGIFLNRAAMKMANMDYAFDFMFTNPVDMTGNCMVGENQLLYFADVCAGPGGFSEYILWRKKWEAKGIGFTLTGSNDFKLDNFFSGPCETFQTYYGVNNDGNVYDPDNIKSLKELVLKSTHGKGVHFMMADGGFSVDGNENNQELLCKQLYLCQFLVALMIVRPEGHFVCKVFDLFSRFSVGLIYLMYRAFNKVCIFKPNTSRPANSERYLVCKWKRADSDSIAKYMFEMNEKMIQLHKSKKDIVECVPMSLLREDEFSSYVSSSNYSLGVRQVVNLAKISAFFRDSTLQEPTQHEIMIKCLEIWNVPNMLRKRNHYEPSDLYNKLVVRNTSDLLKTFPPTELVPKNLSTCFKNIYDWHCIVLGSEERQDTRLGLFISTGRNQLFRYDKTHWKAMTCDYEVSPGTLFMGEITPEFVRSGKRLRRYNALHIFDAHTLGFKDISGRDYLERLKVCKLFVESLTKKFLDNEISNIKVIQPIPMEHIGHVTASMQLEMVKGNMEVVTTIDDFILPTKGILFINSIKAPWIKFKSKKGYYYYYNTDNADSVVERSPESISKFADCLSSLVVWRWKIGVGFKNEGEHPDAVHKDKILSFVQAKIQ